MKIKHLSLRIALLIMLMLTLTIVSTQLRADTGSCGGQVVTLPFTDVMGNFFFCQIAAAYFSGLTNGTTATTYTPGASVPREQMAAFVTRTLDQSLKRGHTRAALGQWSTNRSTTFRYNTFTGYHPQFLACDGLTVWVSNTEANNVSRVDIKTGTVICTISGIPSPEQIVTVTGSVFVASAQSPGKIYFGHIDVTTNATFEGFGNTGSSPIGMTYDGQNLWTANLGGGSGGLGSISRVSLDPIQSSTFTTGFSLPIGILFDGANLWVTDIGDISLKRVDTSTGAVLQTIALSGTPNHPVFDGTNLWIPSGDRVFVVRGAGGLTGTVPIGTVLAQLTGNGLNGASWAAFDGERICVTSSGAQSVSLWKATDLSPITSVNPFGAYESRGVCSDGLNFFVGMRDTMSGGGLIVRF